MESRTVAVHLCFFTGITNCK